MIYMEQMGLRDASIPVMVHLVSMGSLFPWPATNRVSPNPVRTAEPIGTCKLNTCRLSMWYIPRVACQS